MQTIFPKMLNNSF